MNGERRGDGNDGGTGTGRTRERSGNEKTDEPTALDGRRATRRQFEDANMGVQLCICATLTKNFS